jgi:hypothetical protein
MKKNENLNEKYIHINIHIDIHIDINILQKPTMQTENENNDQISTTPLGLINLIVQTDNEIICCDTI